MANYWIVTERGHGRHLSLATAEKARAALAAKKPHRTFKIVRCKTHVEPGPAFAQLRALATTMARMTPPGRDPEDDAATLARLIDEARTILDALAAREADLTAGEGRAHG